jgi:UDP-N-acetylmuramoyl-L-alanyl-D-glutamate--2,6-diaminopimelate ligase
MAANAGLAIVMLVEAGFDFDEIARVLERDGGITAYLPGRTEKVSGTRGPNVFVDFGHSPDAFEHTLAAVRHFTSGRTIMVFGADGDRDATKRFDMGRVAAQGCDILVITDHHPRFEDPASIREQLLVGARSVDNGPEIHEVSPPEDAIIRAVSLAREGDSILWAGPGHQDYRDIRGERTVYSARELARASLRDSGWLD